MSRPDPPIKCAVPVTGGTLGGATWHSSTPAPHGQPASAVVLGLHDLIGNHLWWAQVASRLLNSLTFVAPDLRGRGASAGLPGPYGIAQHVDDLRRVLDAMATSPLVVLAGHGTGALLAEILAERLRGERQMVVVAVDEPATTADLSARADLMRTRLHVTYAHRSEHIAWWLSQPGCGRGADRATRRALEHDLVGHGFGWQVTGSRSAVERDIADLDEIMDDRKAAPPTSHISVSAHSLLGMLEQPTADKTVAAIGMALAAHTAATAEG